MVGGAPEAGCIARSASATAPPCVGAGISDIRMRTNAGKGSVSGCEAPGGTTPMVPGGVSGTQVPATLAPLPATAVTATGGFSGPLSGAEERVASESGTTDATSSNRRYSIVRRPSASRVAPGT